jgi:hypothetical protein
MAQPERSCQAAGHTGQDASRVGHKGTGPKYARFGRHVRYRLSDVIAWEDQQFADLYGEQ